MRFSDTERVVKVLGDEAMRQEDGIKLFSMSAQDIANKLRMPKEAAQTCLESLEASGEVGPAVSSPETEWWLTPKKGWKKYREIKKQKE